MSKRWTIFLVVLSTLFWGANFNAGKMVVEHLPPMTAAAMRFVLASLLIVCLVLWKEKNIIHNVKTNWKIFIVLGVIGVAGFNALFFYGIKYTSPVNGALIMATNPLVALLLGAMLLREPIRLNQCLGVVVSLLGILVVEMQGSLDKLLHFTVARGDLIIMVANICWGLYGALSRRYIKNSQPLITTASTVLIGTVVLVVLASFGDVSLIQLTNQDWSVYAAIVFMAIFGSVLAYLFWNYGIANLGVGHTAMYFNLVPVFTVLISLEFGQSISALQLIGGAFVILGVIISVNSVRMPSKKLAK